MAQEIESKDLRVKKRQPLQEVVPLATPFLAYIDPTSACNFRCSFCPTADKELLEQVGRPIRNMKFDVFKKIIDDLKEFPDKLKLLSLYKDGEPLLHKKFPEMVAYAKQANVSERIWTKTNGSLFEPNLNQKLIDAGIDLINISVEAVSSDGYLKIADVEFDYEAFRRNLQDLYDRRGNCEIYIKICDTGLSEDEKKKFYDDFSSMSTYIAIENLMGWSYSGIKDFMLGEKPDTYDGLPLIDKMACAIPLYVMAVNASGTVSLCGNDWSHNTVVGDVNRQSMREIWESDALYEFRKMHLENRRGENKACGDCYYLKVIPDNIDAHREDILRSLTRARGDRPAAAQKSLRVLTT